MSLRGGSNVLNILKEIKENKSSLTFKFFYYLLRYPPPKEEYYLDNKWRKSYFADDYYNAIKNYDLRNEDDWPKIASSLYTLYYRSSRFRVVLGLYRHMDLREYFYKAINFARGYTPTQRTYENTDHGSILHKPSSKRHGY